MKRQTRDSVVDFVLNWSAKVGWPVQRFLKQLSISSNRFYDWKKRYEQESNNRKVVPKSHWLLPWEVEAIIAYAKENPKEGYRRLAYMMLDDNIVATSASSVYRVLKREDLLHLASPESKKGKGFNQPTKPHQHWHTDISYLNIAGTFFYFMSVLDGYSRAILHWELRESMKEADVEITIQRAREKYPGHKTRVISDNGPQFIAIDFKRFVRQLELTHVTTSPYYPQSNGKLERFHRTLKNDGIKQGDLLTYEIAKERLTTYIDYYNNERLHSAIGYVAPSTKLAGKEQEIFVERKLKLSAARAERKRAMRAPNLQSNMSFANAPETSNLPAC